MNRKGATDQKEIEGLQEKIVEKYMELDDLRCKWCKTENDKQYDILQVSITNMEKEVKELEQKMASLSNNLDTTAAVRGEEMEKQEKRNEEIQPDQVSEQHEAILEHSTPKGEEVRIPDMIDLTESPVLKSPEPPDIQKQISCRATPLSLSEEVEMTNEENNETSLSDPGL